MRNSILLLFISIVLITTHTSVLSDAIKKQPGAMKYYGGQGHDSAGSLIITKKGTFALAGYTNKINSSKTSLWVVHINSSGKILFDKKFGGTGKENPLAKLKDSIGVRDAQDSASAILEVDDGFLVCGVAESKGAGQSDAWLIKIDTNCKLLWDRTYGTADHEEATSMQALPDGKILLVGISVIRNRSYGTAKITSWLKILDPKGDLLQEKIYPEGVYFRIIQKMKDGNYVLLGTKKIENVPQIWLCKIDGEGNKIWEETAIGDTAQKRPEQPDAVRELPDGNLIITGSKGYWGTNEVDALIMKTDQKGKYLWKKFLGGKLPDVISDILSLSDRGFIAVGKTRSFGAGYYDAWFIRLDRDGNKIWDKTYGTASEDFASSILELPGGNCLVLGTSETGQKAYKDAWLLKLDKEGIPLEKW